MGRPTSRLSGDHVDDIPCDFLGIFLYHELRKHILQGTQELEWCRRQYAGRLIIRAGIEIGEPHLFAEEVRQMRAKYPFDYALGSLHWVGKGSIFTADYFRCAAEEAFGRYFEELERMTRSGEFEILSHLDVPVRTAFEIYGSYDPCRYEALIRPVLQNCIERGIALEVDAGTLRRNAGILTPGRAILEWYAGMGGEHLTMGSDAHHPAHVAAGLDVAMATARAAGLRHLTQFESGQAQLIPLP